MIVDDLEEKLVHLVVSAQCFDELPTYTLLEVAT